MYGLPNIHSVYTSVVSSATLLSPGVYIGGAQRVGIEVPTFVCYVCASTTHVYVRVSNEKTTGFKRLQAATGYAPYSSVTGTFDWAIMSSAGGRTILCDQVVGFNYMQLELSETATTNADIRVHIVS